MFELTLLSAGTSIPLGEEPLHVGRGPSNHLVLSDDTVSWNHAQLWVEGGRAWVRDLSSRNGTFRNGDPLKGMAPLEPGDEIQFGTKQKVVLRVPFGERVTTYRILQLVEVATGMQHMLRGNRFHLGSGPDAHLRVDGPERLATLSISEEEVWVGTEDEEYQIAIDEVFSVGGRRFRITVASMDHVPTVEVKDVDYAYSCRAVSNGPRGPEVFLEDDRGHKHHCIGNRAILLLILARQLAMDREQGSTEEEEGWVSDADVCTGIWGRGQGSKSGLNVLVHRTRKQLGSDGFDPWFIEKKRRGIRARLQHVTVD